MFIKFLFGFYFFLALACIRAENAANKETIRLIVNHYRVPCVGAGAQLCYLAKEGGASSWEYLFEGIDGFRYEWGKVYELEVEKSRRKDVKADQSPVSYKLIRVIRSEDAPVDEAFPLIVKDADMVAIRKSDNGGLSLLGQYPLRCASDSLCEDLDSRLENAVTVTGLFAHSQDRHSLVLQSLKN